jgi:hypothetical protein
MTNKYEHIETLLERFFEGLTSNVEEQKLYEFFSGYDVPEHLLRYKKVFAYFDIGLSSEIRMAETAEEDINEAFDKNDTFFAEDLENELRDVKVPVRNLQYGKWILWAGVAASLLVLILLNPLGLGTEPFDPFEGSYIVRNGVRITDPKTIRPELEATVQDVLQQQEAAESLFAKLTESEKPVINGEEYQKSQYFAILEGFQDENVRNEVRKILEQE